LKLLIKTELKWTSLLFSWAFKVLRLDLRRSLGNRLQTPTLIGCILLKITRISSICCIFFKPRCDQQSLAL